MTTLLAFLVGLALGPALLFGASRLRAHLGRAREAQGEREAHQAVKEISRGLQLKNEYKLGRTLLQGQDAWPYATPDPDDTTAIPIVGIPEEPSPIKGRRYLP